MMNYIKPEDIKAYVEQNPTGIAGMSEELTAMVNHFVEQAIRECIEKSLEERIDPDLIEQEQDIEDRCYLRGSNSGIIDAVCAIKQHFGVEE